MLNRCVLMGRFTAEPELRKTQSGTSCCSFTLAVERDGEPDEDGKKKTDFLDFVAWRGTAEFISRYFHKGRMAAVEGKIQTRTWKDREDRSRKATEIIVDSIYFADSKKDEAAGGFTEPEETDGELPF